MLDMTEYTPLSDFARPETRDALAALREVRKRQDTLRQKLADLDVVELEAAHAARDAGASWRELALAAGLAKFSSAQRRYDAGSIEERRAQVAASKIPGAKAAPDPLPGVSLAEAATRLGITVSQVRTRADRGELSTVTATYRGREVRRVILD